MPMTFAMPNLVTLNDVELTDEGRQPIGVTTDERSVTVELASGALRKYVKGIFRKFSITWTNVARSASHTVDGLGGRDEIIDIILTDHTMTLQLVDDYAGTTDTFTVFLEGYQEELAMRRASDESWRYNITLDLIEVYD